MAQRRHPASLLALALLLSLSASQGVTQTYPSKVIRYILPSSPGGGADVIARILAGNLSKTLGQQVIVDNRAGASGNIGAELVAKAPPDGYMLLQSNIVHAANMSLFKDLTYDLARDFAPITQLASTPAVLVVHPSLPVKSVTELIALAKKRPMAINFGSAGPGSSSFLAAALFLGAADAKMLHVPYRGGGQAIAAVVAGETSVYFSPLGSALSQIEGRKLRALAVTTSKRFPALQDYPTVAEAGLPGYEFDNWYGLVAPAKTPSQIITTLHSAVVAILKEPEANKRLDALGYIPVGNQPAAFGSYVRSEIDRLRKVAHLLAE